MKPRSLISVTLALFVLMLCLASCGKYTNKDRTPNTPSKLRVSMIPTTDPGSLLRQSQPLIDYLQKETGATIELTVPTNYAAVVQAITSDQVDLAYLGGFTYVQAAKRAGVKPLVQRERDQLFHSFFITQPGSGISSLADLKGRTFAFGDVNSTSGHLMPEYFMREANVDSDVMARAIYTGGHDATALAVANGKVDAGALDESVYERMTKDNKLDPQQVKIFYKTPPFFDYVWAARKDLDPVLINKFINAFLKLNSNDAEQKKVLELLSATKYVRANDADYDKLRQAATVAGLLK